MEGKSSTDSGLFLPDVCQLRSFLNDVTSRLKFFLKTLKCSSGQVECSFDKPAGIFLFRKKLFFQNRLMWQICCRLRIK